MMWGAVLFLTIGAASTISETDEFIKAEVEYHYVTTYPAFAEGWLDPPQGMISVIRSIEEYHRAVEGGVLVIDCMIGWEFVPLPEDTAMEYSEHNVPQLMLYQGQVLLIGDVIDSVAEDSCEFLY